MSPRWLLSLSIAICGCSGTIGGNFGGGAAEPGAQGGGSSVGGGAALGGGVATGGGAATGGGSATGVGNPYGSCSAGVPASGALVDTAQPTTVVGNGTAASCTFSSLSAAVAQGGIITFDCGPAPFTFAVTSTLTLRIDRDTVIDGNNLITLDGQNAVQLLNWNSPNFRALDDRLTLQRLRLVNGKTTPTQAIPTAPAPCSQGWDDGEGGALFMRDGNLTVIDCVFETNHGAPLGPDTGGGAIYLLGSKHGALIVHSTFTDNDASNGGALGALFSELDIYDSLFQGNSAIGNGANYDDASKCSVINNGQHEVGSGGNGGALYSDGQSVDITLCGDAVLDNGAGTGAFGGGLFFTSNDMKGTLSITDTTMTGNTGGHWTNVATGSVTNAGTAVGTNAYQITLSSSTLQGVP